MRIELLTSPGCPNADPARRVITEALTTLGIDTPILDQVGRFRSPTVLVDGIDVMSPDAGPATGDACRLDLPTPDAVVRAIRAAMNRDRPTDHDERQVR
ncbi:alkylmercury lyase [Skermania sp. ID1734]|uniref:alkylmercury lyase n=1 Tax=Skermania sp. ID1734 TaxID=2597516 RepID=UPI00117E32E1|nr:alkylmercury lyase [Skermania sp. ID1734]TSD94895.1 alkylmercury lyase [Skermania sp. ID1734]